MSKGNVFAGIVSGLALGALLGVLFAPAKGSETRQKISEKGTDLAGTLKTKFDQFIDDLTGANTPASNGKVETPEQ